MIKISLIYDSLLRNFQLSIFNFQFAKDIKAGKRMFKNFLFQF